MKCCYSFLALDDNQVLHILQLKLDSASKLRSLLSMQVVCALCSHSLLTVNSVFPVYGYFLLFSCSCLSIHPRSWRPPPPPSLSPPSHTHRSDVVLGRTTVSPCLKSFLLWVAAVAHLSKVRHPQQSLTRDVNYYYSSPRDALKK